MEMLPIRAIVQGIRVKRRPAQNLPFCLPPMPHLRSLSSFPTKTEAFSRSDALPRTGELAIERVVLANLPSSWHDANVQEAVTEQLAAVGCGDIDVICTVARVGRHSTRTA